MSSARQINLFPDLAPPERVRDVRREAREAAFEHANDLWKQQYRAFVIEYARTHEDFTAENCQLAYKQTANIQPTEWRASGSIFVRLLRQRIIVRDGYGWSKVRRVPVPKFRKA